MRGRTFFLLLLLGLFLIAAPSCRSRRPVAAPQPAPASISPSTTARAPEVAVPAPTPSEFHADTSNHEVLSSNIEELNRTASNRGWIADAFFAFDSFALDTAAQEALRRSANWLRAHPEYNVRVEGHCDERGTEQYNFALGDRRASAASSYLVALGVLPERISTISYGESRPFAKGSTEAAWAQNRRAHLVLLVGR